MVVSPPIIIFILVFFECDCADVIFHGAGLVKDKDDIRGDVFLYDLGDLGASGEGLQGDGIEAVRIELCRFADVHAAVGIIRVGRRAGHQQRAEQRQAQKQR